MIKYLYACELLILMSITTVAHSQLLKGDSHFPVLNELRWEMNMDEVRRVCENSHMIDGTTDTTLTLNVPILGFSTKTKIIFNSNSKMLKHLDVKFNDPSKIVGDSVISYLSYIFGRPPERTSKEKSFLFFTFHAEVAFWEMDKDVIIVATGLRGSSIMEIKLSMKRKY